MDNKTAADINTQKQLATDVQQYLEQRVDNQILWYDKKSQSNQAWFKRLRVLGRVDLC